RHMAHGLRLYLVPLHATPPNPPPISSYKKLIKKASLAYGREGWNQMGKSKRDGKKRKERQGDAIPPIQGAACNGTQRYQFPFAEEEDYCRRRQLVKMQITTDCRVSSFNQYICTPTPVPDSGTSEDSEISKDREERLKKIRDKPESKCSKASLENPNDAPSTEFSVLQSRNAVLSTVSSSCSVKLTSKVNLRQKTRHRSETLGVSAHATVRMGHTDSEQFTWNGIDLFIHQVYKTQCLDNVDILAQHCFG
ncbi:hypothetical protein STEG23_022501, partial [Scotinomys teguina]